MKKENNVKIALFMGATLCKREDLYYPAEGNWYQGFDGIPHPMHEEHLDYHSSWDWIMPVVEKIENSMHLNMGFGYSVEISNWECRIKSLNGGQIIAANGVGGASNASSKIDAVYKSIIQFIDYQTKTP